MEIEAKRRESDEKKLASGAALAQSADCSPPSAVTGEYNLNSKNIILIIYFLIKGRLDFFYILIIHIFVNKINFFQIIKNAIAGNLS